MRTGPSARRAIIAKSGNMALPEAGQRIDCFELEEAIGIGGMGAVFRALDTRLDRHVALKLLPPEQAGDAEVVQRFYQEGRAAARLDHENIARVFTIGHDANYHFIAFEFIEGTTIRQRVERNGPLPVSEAINYTLQIAGALVHATERGVVHRDIKPSNIIVTPQGRAKLVDMGLARRFERGSDDGLTQSGMTLGTFDYISPEQARDPRDVDVRSDLYSLGCTLFQMLTGRPPFPDGTVLQKLLQHQEEPPPDVCAINPLVPPDLASILVKLMAKDRDRRYQTPEQLVRDLLTVAGTLGLRSISPEGLVWMSASAPAAWERHLVWALPALAFALVMAALVWWGQDAGSPSLHAQPDVLPRLTVEAPGPTAGQAPRNATDRAPREVASRQDKPGEVVPAATPAPRDFDVESSEDLLAVLASAPAHSIVVLTDDGPYLLGWDAADRQRLQPLLDRDLTIKAAPGVLPTLRLAREAVVGDRSPSALLDLEGGRVTLEGLEFVLDPDGHVGPIAAVQAEDTELTVRHCRFRTLDPRTPADRIAALHVRANEAATAGGDRPAAVVADACHFDGGQIGVLAQGPVDLQLRDCTLGGTEPAIWLDNPARPLAFAPEVRLRHDSLIAGDAPVFRFEGTAPRVWVEDTVIAPARDAEATLIATDDPEGLDWRGRGNFYGRIGTYLQPTGARARRETVHEFVQWAEDANRIRETGSTSTPDRPWSEADPEEALAQQNLNPIRAFRLTAGHPGGADVGARPRRQGALDPIAAGINLASRLAEDRRDREREARPLSAPSPETSPSDSLDAPAPMPVAEPDAPAPMPMPMPMAEPDAEESPSTLVRMPDMPEMPVMPPTGREGLPARTSPAIVSPPHGDEDGSATPAPPATGSGSGPLAAPLVAADPGVLRTSDQLVAILNRPGARGGTLWIAADADWVLTGAQVRSAGRWTLRAEPGPTRPRFRFRPTPADPKTPTAWPLGIDLRSGILQCEGIDFILESDEAPPLGRWGVFGVGVGTELNLSDCTVTIEGDEFLSAAVVAQAPEPVGDEEGEAKGEGPDREPTPARVVFSDCLLRSGGNLAEVAAGGQLALELSNVVVSTGGSLVHAHGLPRGQAVAAVKLTLRQVTARMTGGLVQLESALGEPELPLAEISARDSILATTAQGAPLLQVDGQDDLGSLQNRIQWDGVRVAYHQINAYRRDQTAQVGTVPKIYNRPDWMVAVGPQEEAPIHGDLKFLQKWSPDRPAWLFRRDDFRLAPESPAASSGADLAQVPPAPPVS